MAPALRERPMIPESFLDSLAVGSTMESIRGTAFAPVCISIEAFRVDIRDLVSSAAPGIRARRGRIQ